jgi:hypothetical protein
MGKITSSSLFKRLEKKWKEADQALKDHFSSSFQVISCRLVMAFIILSKTICATGFFHQVKT